MIVCELTSYKFAPPPELRAEHLRFLRGRGDRGALLMAGRFADGRGALILWDVASVEEAKKAAEEDPYVRGGAVDYELREWPRTFDYTKDPPVVPGV